MSLQDLELLAPAGSMEVLQTVVEAGADAIYLGGKRFNMRLLRPEFNFSDAELAKAVKYLHHQQKKIYITVNNLYNHQEVEELKDYLRLLQDLQVDALIVQDMGLVTLCQEIGIKTPLHASVQMGINNLEAVRVLEASGFSRVILSRHLKLEEIQVIHQASQIGIEHFVHGELCVCHTGQCHLSSFLFQESSNRGRCRKPCRWPYQMAGLEQMESNGPRYYLAQKDLCLYPHLQDMTAAGVSSFKIEGRMRSQEQLALIVNSYRQALDALLANPSSYRPPAQALKQLQENRIRDYCSGSIYKTANKDDIGLNGQREPLFPSAAVPLTPLRGGDFPLVREGEAAPLPVQAELTVAVGDLDGLQKMLALGVDNIIITLNSMRQHREKWDLDRLKPILNQRRADQRKILLETPRIVAQQNLDALYNLKDWADHNQVDGFVVNDLGSLKILQSNERSLWTGYGLNVTNAKAAAFMKNLGVHRITVSLEMSAADLHALTPLEMPMELMVHGPLPGMVSDLCLIQTALAGNPDCCSQECVQDQTALLDEHGQAYKIYTDYHCRNYIYHPYERCLYPYLRLPLSWGINSLRIDGPNYPPKMLTRVVYIYQQALQECRAGLHINQAGFHRLLKLFPNGLTAMPFISTWDTANQARNFERGMEK